MSNIYITKVCQIKTQTFQNKEYVNVLHHAFMNWWVCVLIGGGGGLRHLSAFILYKGLCIVFKCVQINRVIQFYKREKTLNHQ